MRARWLRFRRSVLRWLGPPGPPGLSTGGWPNGQERAYLTARSLVRLFYAAALYLLSVLSPGWPGWAAAETLDPLWPIAWVRLAGVATVVHVVMVLALVGSVAGLLAPDRRLGRVLAFAGLLQLAALLNSFGKVGHGYHGWVVASFWLMFLPASGPAPPARRRLLRQRYLQVVWAVLVALLVGYSISGFWKVAVGLYQVGLGEVSAFGPRALAYHVARRSLQTQTITPVGAFIVAHPWLGWPFFLGALYLEMFAVVAAFRPRLHRLWGLGLMAFHLGSNMALGIGHWPQVLLLGIMAVGSPLAPERLEVRATLADLPVLGWLVRRRHRRPAPPPGRTRGSADLDGRASPPIPSVVTPGADGIR